jgi:broad specificity phosphatase PhoE
MKKILVFLLLFFIGQLIIAQNTDPAQFFFIRHAEKVKKGEEDPALTKIGEKRANYWAEVFKNTEFAAVYSTQTKRTLSTALPTANKSELTPIIYKTESIDLKQLAEKYAGKNVLIVGHSNTIPDLVNYLLGDDRVGEIGEFNNSNLYIVRYSPEYSDLVLLYIPIK